jgi:hypothetical protein
MSELAWLPLEEMLRAVPFPDKILVEQLSRAHIDEVVARLRAWYPDIAVGTESRHLDPEFRWDARSAPKWPSTSLR